MGGARRLDLCSILLEARAGSNMVASTSLGNEFSKLFKVFDDPSRFYEEIMNASGKKLS